MENATTSAQSAYGVSALINNHDPLSHAVLAVLGVMSFFTWYIILTKLWDQHKLASSFKAVEGWMASCNPPSALVDWASGRHSRAAMPSFPLMVDTPPTLMLPAPTAHSAPIPAR